MSSIDRADAFNNCQIAIIKATITCSERSKTISKSIDEIEKDVFNISDDMLAAVIQSNMKLAQEILHSYLISSSFEAKKQLWNEQTGIHELSKEEADSKTYQINIVNLAIIKDSDDLPLKLLIKYTDGSLIHNGFIIDLPAIFEEYKDHRSKDLSFLLAKNIHQMQTEAEELVNKCKRIDMPMDKKLKYLNIFNERWKDQYEAVYEEENEKGIMTIHNPTLKKTVKMHEFSLK